MSMCLNRGLLSFSTFSLFTSASFVASFESVSPSASASALFFAICMSIFVLLYRSNVPNAAASRDPAPAAARAAPPRSAMDNAASFASASMRGVNKSAALGG